MDQDQPKNHLEDPRRVLRRHGLQPKKSWGQNFLVNLALAERIAGEVTESCAELIIEIGAGTGTLTSALAARAPRVMAIERDPDLVALLEAERGSLGDNVDIAAADATSFDYRQAAGDASLAIAGNLPYQLSGRLLRRIVELRDRLELAVVMVQLEVAERLVAPPASSRYGVLSVMTQAFFDLELRFRASPGSFHPRPKVASAVVRLTPLPQPRCGELTEAQLAALVHPAFAARRKTLKNTLSSAFPKAAVLAALEAEAVDPRQRAETLNVEQLAALARRLGPGR